MQFSYWLQSEREIREWSQSDLARRSGLHRAVISKLETGTRPMPETLMQLAKAFNLPPVFVFRKAGLLPEAPSDQVRLEDWEYLLNQLPPDEQEEVRQIALMKIERRQKAEAAARAANFKPKQHGG